MKLLFIFYIASTVLCYWKLNETINQCLDLFKERHPLIKIEEIGLWDDFKLGLKVLGVCMIPVLNVFLASVFYSSDDNILISEIINKVEVDHWSEIREMEEAEKERRAFPF